MNAQASIRKNLTARGWRGIVVGLDWPTAGTTAGYLYDSDMAEMSSPALVRACC